jgi:hypothetical protein
VRWERRCDAFLEEAKDVAEPPCAFDTGVES